METVRFCRAGLPSISCRRRCSRWGIPRQVRQVRQVRHCAMGRNLHVYYYSYYYIIYYYSDSYTYFEVYLLFLMNFHGVLARLAHLAHLAPFFTFSLAISARSMSAVSRAIWKNVAIVMPSRWLFRQLLCLLHVYRLPSALRVRLSPAEMRIVWYILYKV